MSTSSKSENWPVSDKQRSLIMRYAARITWKIPNGFDAWLIRYGVSSVQNIPDWKAAWRIVDALKFMCMTEHHCPKCWGPCTREESK